LEEVHRLFGRPLEETISKLSFLVKGVHGQGLLQIAFRMKNEFYHHIQRARPEHNKNEMPQVRSEKKNPTHTFLISSGSSDNNPTEELLKGMKSQLCAPDLGLA